MKPLYYNDLSNAPSDPILGLNLAFMEDNRPNKVNLGVGAYKTEQLKPYVLPSVLKAEHLMLEAKHNKEYLSIPGDVQYHKSLCELIFELDACNTRPFVFLQSLGGTGALRIGAEFLHHHGPRKIYLPSPSWANHQPIFKGQDLEVESYPYYDPQTKGLDWVAMINALSSLDSSSAVLFHVCCHNPTGVDLNQQQWREVLNLAKERHFLVFFDCAYQGFKENLESDAWPLRYATEQNIPFFLSYSFSKNMGLYGERVGCFIAHLEGDEIATRFNSQLKLLVRRNYSTPPKHGAQIVQTILQNKDLKAQWIKELSKMHERIKSMRQLLHELLVQKNPHLNFDFMNSQNGMFSYLGLSEQQADALTQQFAIYLPKSGRINVAGLSKKNAEYVADAITQVLKLN